MADEENLFVNEDADAAKADAERIAYRPLLVVLQAFKCSAIEDAAAKAQAKAEIIKLLTEDNSAPMYENVCTRLGWQVDAGLLDQMRAANKAEIERLDAAIADAREHHGEVEVAERIRDKAEYYFKIGDKEATLRTFGEVPDKPLSTGQRIDIALALARAGLQHDDLELVKARLAAARELVEKGGDWDRKNRLKVYEAVFAIVNREWSKACTLLLDSVSTFTATELLPYDRLICYTVLTALKSLERPALKKKVVDSPDVRSVINDTPHLAQLLHSFYEGRYRDFLVALTALQPTLAQDKYTAAHAAWFAREMRVAAYNQFLESYKSVTLEGMCRSFGVSTDFLDADLSRFIAAGRVNAKIDAVEGVIETTRADSKNAQYHAVIKQGDALLNKVQRLSRIVTL